MDPQLQEEFNEYMGTSSPLTPESKAAFTEIVAKFDSLVAVIANQYGLIEHQVMHIVLKALQPRYE